MKEFYLVEDMEPHKGLLFFRYTMGSHNGWHFGYLGLCCNYLYYNNTYNWKIFDGIKGKNDYGKEREVNLTVGKLINLLTKNPYKGDLLLDTFKSTINEAFEYVLKDI